MGIAAIEGREIAVIALLRAFPNTIATRGGFAMRSRCFALEPFFELAARRATIRRRVCVVTLLEARDDAISAFRGAAGHARLQADPTRFELASGAATVQGSAVVVVALLRWVDTRITAGERHTSRAWRGAAKTLLDDHAVRGAAVIASAVSIIAGLDRLTHAVPALVRRIDTTAPTSTSGSRIAAQAANTGGTGGTARAAVAPRASDSPVSTGRPVTTGSQANQAHDKR